MRAQERYAAHALAPYQGLPLEVLQALLVQAQAAVEASWAKRVRLAGQPLPRPQTAPTWHQLRLMSHVELLSAMVADRAPPKEPAVEGGAPCQVDYVDYPHPGQVVVTCHESGHVTRSFGHGDKSRYRSFRLMDEECPCMGRHVEGPEPQEEEGEEELPLLGDAPAGLGDDPGGDLDAQAPQAQLGGGDGVDGPGAELQQEGL